MSSALTVSWSNVSPRLQKIAPWIVCFTAALFFFFEFIQLNAFNALTPHLMQAFHVGSEKIGLLSAHYFYANVLFLLVAGALLDRFSTRRIILFAMSVCVLFTFLFSLTTQLWQAEVCRFLTGAGGAFCFLSSVRLATRWFLPKRMALVIGSVVTIAMLGGVVAQAPFTLLVDGLGWRHALMIDAALGVFILLLIFCFVADFPPGQASRFYREHDEIAKQGVWLSLCAALSNRQNWLAGLYTCFMNLPIFLLGAIWGGLFLVQVHHLSRTGASEVTTMVFLGTIVGSPLLGWLSDRIKQRRLPMIVFAVLSFMVVLILIYTPHLSFVQLAIIFFILGFFTSAQIISYPLVAESNPRSIIGTAEGLASVLIMAGGMLQPIFGWLMQLHWNHVVVNQVPVYLASDYRLALMTLPVAFVISFICVIFIKETHCKVIKSASTQKEELSSLPA